MIACRSDMPGQNARTRLPVHDCKYRTAKTGLPRHDFRDRTDRADFAMT